MRNDGKNKIPKICMQKKEKKIKSKIMMKKSNCISSPKLDKEEKKVK